MDGFNVDVDTRETLRNLARLDEQRRKELKVIVNETSRSVQMEMKSLVKPHRNTGRLYKSIRVKKTNPRAYRPIQKEERELFKSVHPRNKTGRHWPFLDSGTQVRRGGQNISIGGVWVSTTTRGSVQGINFRERARTPAIQSEFNRRVEGVANRNEQV